MDAAFNAQRHDLVADAASIFLHVILNDFYDLSLFKGTAVCVDHLRFIDPDCTIEGSILRRRYRR